jgi:hypothetical protein
VVGGFEALLLSLQELIQLKDKVAETVGVFLDLDKVAEPIHFFPFPRVHVLLSSTSPKNTWTPDCVSAR